MGNGDGDYKDMATSPNDPIFFLVHANVERNKMAWMNLHASSASSFYGYPLKGSTVSMSNPCTASSSVYPGIGLYDPVSSNWGFTDADLGVPFHSSRYMLWSHADALRFLSPAYAPYTYDSITAGFEMEGESSTTVSSTTTSRDVDIVVIMSVGVGVILVIAMVVAMMRYRASQAKMMNDEEQGRLEHSYPDNSYENATEARNRLSLNPMKSVRLELIEIQATAADVQSSENPSNHLKTETIEVQAESSQLADVINDENILK